MIIPEWAVIAWVWLGLGVAFALCLYFLLYIVILIINYQGKSIHRKMKAMYAFKEVDYWLGQHIKQGKIMMSTDTGKYVWVATRGEKLK